MSSVVGSVISVAADYVNPQITDSVTHVLSNPDNDLAVDEKGTIVAQSDVSDTLNLCNLNEFTGLCVNEIVNPQITDSVTYKVDNRYEKLQQSDVHDNLLAKSDVPVTSL